jgi:putative phage-type endonuclease
LQQGTPEWHEARKGKLTASNVGAALGLCLWTSRKVAFNRAMGLDVFEGNDATRWGSNNEDNAILAYSAHTGNLVEKTGLHVHEHTPWLAGSPDGLVGTEGMVEAKCPYWKKQVHFEVPLYYYMQMNLCLECANREWCDYISWTPEAYMHPAMLAAFARVRMCISSGAWRPAAQLVGEAFLPMGLLELVEQCTSLMPAERPSSAKVHLGLVRLLEEASELSSDSSLRRDDLWLRRRKRYDYDVSMRPLRDAYRAVALTTPAPVPFSELERRRHSMVALRAVAAREAAGQARQISAVDIQRISGEDPDGQIYSA